MYLNSVEVNLLELLYKWHLYSIDDSLQEKYSGQFFELEDVEVVLRHVHHRNEIMRGFLREQGTLINNEDTNHNAEELNFKNIVINYYKVCPIVTLFSHSPK
jgi:hypothetical protein